MTLQNGFVEGDSSKGAGHVHKTHDRLQQNAPSEPPGVILSEPERRPGRPGWYTLMRLMIYAGAVLWRHL